MTVRLAVVSDSHGHLGNTLAAVRRLADERIDTVIHCGDIGTPAVVPLFAAWPTHFVFGNVDHDKGSLKLAIRDAGQSCHDRFGILQLAGCNIAFLHSDDAWRFREAIDGQAYDLVCYGHTHVAEVHREGRTTVLNPGALYRAATHTVAVVDLPAVQVTHLTIDDDR